MNALLGVKVADPTEVDLEDVVAAPGKEHPADEVAVAAGLDGWHYSLEALDAFPVRILAYVDSLGLL